ncbi:hypothetical protein [Pseudomonas sp. CFBP 8772]|uniref:hypothetical protein n=1 Tax=Pseudomonas sp. CFBP 8772 TaxID=2775284 RepID=UPI001785F89B|nr:hypothetical protein [Pseudomonas sp. CFBP 8772]MBD8597398.1 hypothetical protein [Pseudomonas sp. CFBP 8772]
MSLQARGSEVRHDLVDIAARLQIARDHWSVHAEALHRIGLINEEELREMLLYADAAYGHVLEE